MAAQRIRITGTMERDGAWCEWCGSPATTGDTMLWDEALEAWACGPECHRKTKARAEVASAVRDERKP